nr:Ycf1.1 [Starmerella bombicola]
MEDVGINFGSLFEPWAWQKPNIGDSVSVLPLNHTISAPSRFLCKEGWRITNGLQLSRCFSYGILLQIPTLLALILVLPGCVQLYHRKQLMTTPLASQKRQKRRIWLQTALSLALMINLMVNAFTSQRFNDITFVGDLAISLSVPLAMILMMMEVVKSTKPSGSLLLYWLSFALATLAMELFVPFGLSLAIFLLEWIQPRRDSGDSRQGNPYDQADLFSKLTFSWMTPLMREGYENFLTSDHLPDLPSKDRADACNDIFEEHWEEQLETHPKSPSIFMALIQSFGMQYVLGGVCKAVQDALAFAQPQLLKMLIGFVTEYTSSNGDLPLTRGIYIALGMFAVSAVQTVILHQYFERSFGTGMNVRTALTNAIFRKSLILSNEARDTRTTGDTVNLMSIDTQRIQDVCTNGNMIWSGPFQIILCLVSLYQLMGNSMWVGVIVLVMLVPINSYLASTQKTLQKQQMSDKDLRTRLTSELLSSIKSIKLYAWEDAFLNRLQHVRNDKELTSLRKIGVFQACMSYIWTFTPFIVSCSTFAVYVFVAKKTLTTEIVFPALALFNMLGFPMAVFPMLITGLIESNVALKRITNYLTGEELQPEAVTRVSAATNVGEPGVVLSNATFVYKASNSTETDNAAYAIRNVSLASRAGELTCVVGQVGSGKSSLLISILGDLRKINGSVTVGGTVAYVAQNPWIFNGSVRENILFGHRYDEELYAETIAACALRDDLAILPEGDDSLVGEKGISLSGGQKARLSLARAVYARADVYLLDDPLSAVDEHVGQHIIRHVLSKTGLLASKTVILATNSIPVLQHAHQLAMISNGEICEVGLRKDFKNLPRISALLKDYGRKHIQGDEHQEPGNENIKNNEPDSIRVSETPAPEDDEEPTIIVGSRSNFNGDRRPSIASLKPTMPLEVRKEHVETGKVSWSVYSEYARVCSLPRVAMFIGIIVTSTSFSVMGNVWLKHWAEANGETGSNDHIFWYLGIYALLGTMSSGLTVVQSLVAYIVISLHAAKQLHEKMLRSVLRAPMSFFETNPLGRIVNRFSSDVYRVDQQLMRVIFMLFNNCVRVAFTIAIICYSTPVFILIAAPLGYFYLYYQRYYLRTSRELKRLDSTSKSPIFAQFQETLDGISTIRAFDATERFNFRNRIYIDTNNKAYFPSISANRWLAVRLELVGSIIILASSGLGVLALPSGRISAGVIGLALSYALQVTQSLNWIVRMTVEVETNIVSVERMMEYSQLTPEAPSKTDIQLSEDWPNKGEIKLVDYSTRYRPELPLVLKSINLEIKPHEKIGIVGRTGAGKSSLTLALFRLIEAAEGHITVDGVKTADVGLKDLRSNLSIIPQDSQLFEGSVRENLDPASRYTDVKLWRALELSHLKEHISSMDGQLDAKINEGGSNLSSGQRQLLSLARALLTDSKVLVLDEATAAVDVETDQVLQQVIRKEFKDRTILTIAHRLNTILDSDRVVVLSFGEVVEFDKPSVLMADESSQFYALCKRGGII